MERMMLEQSTENQEDRWPLSLEQEYLWLQEQLYANSKGVSYFYTIKFTGKLEIELLEICINEIIKRHEILRTYFPVEEGLPKQAIRPYQYIELSLSDISRLNIKERNFQYESLLKEEKTYSFNTAEDFLFRTRLIRISDKKHILVIHASRLVSDELSMKNLFKELSQVYRALQNKDDFSLPEIPFQYKNYITTKESNLSEEETQHALSYWRDKLKREIPKLNLPFDHPKPSSLSFSGQTYSFTISKNIYEKIKILSEQEQTEPSIVMLTVLKVLLYRYSGEEDISVGTFVSGRNHLEITRLVGQFSNMLVMRSQLHEDMAFRDALHEVHKVYFEAVAHQKIPISKLIAEFNNDNTRNRNPFFQVMLDMPEFKKEKMELPDLLIEEVGFAYDTTLFDFTLRVTKGPQGEMDCTFIYHPDLFKEGTIKRMAGHIENLLKGVLEDSNASISQVTLLTDEEIHQLLVEWNAPKGSRSLNASIPQLFEEQVETNPDGVALIYGNTRITYRELDIKANQIANYLKSLNLEQEQLVAVCLDRSPETIFSFLGVLKAGGAYVPFDLSYPKERIAYMLYDSGASFIIASENTAKGLPPNKARVILLDKEAKEIAKQPVERIDYSTPEQLANVIYTSGSTGKPKGVEIIHRGVVRLVKNNPTYAKLGPEEVILNRAPLAFDVSVFEIYGSLLNGGKLVIMESNKPSFEEIARTIKQNGVTILRVGPDMLNLLIEDYFEDLVSLRQVFSGGEVLPVWIANKFLLKFKECRLINAYGPTENTVNSTYYPVKEIMPNTTSIPIGRPIANDCTYILDKYQQPVPIGVTGELYLSGDGIARGYLNRPELTKDRFPTVQFNDGREQRLYKSGDLARYSSDGNIHFMGRADEQVKVKGVRIELGEVETVVSQYPGVRQSVASTIKGTRGMNELVAYVVMDKDAKFDQQKLRFFLQKKLPENMIPTFFVEIQKIPLTPVGKIDRKGLPAPVISVSKEEIVLPRNEVEKKLVQIWESLLGVSPIGVTDRYFELGGNSLIAMQLFSVIEKTFGKSLSVSSIFSEDTVEGLAKHISSNEQMVDMSSSLVPIQPAGTLPPIFCIHGGGGEVLVYKELSLELGDNQPVYGLRFSNEENLKDLTVEMLAEKYVNEIKQIQPAGPYFLLGFCFGGAIAYEMAQLLLQKGEQVKLLTILNFANPQYTPVEIPEEITYKKIIMDNVKLLYKKPLKQKFSFFIEKTQNAMKLLKNTSVSDATEKEYTSSKPILRRAISNYQPKPFPGNLLLINVSEVSKPKDTMGWKVTEAGCITVKSVPAKHETLLQEPYVSKVVAYLKESIGMVSI